MRSEKRYEILSSLPTYGPMYVPVSENGEPFYSEGFPVRFYKTDGAEWVANFQSGWTGLKEVIEFEETENLLVIACGTCYFMNPNDTKPVQVFGVDYCNIFKISGGRLVLQNESGLTIIETDGSYWHTERISWDGLKEIKVENNIVTGLSFDPAHDADEWIPFAYDLNKRILTGGGYNKHGGKKPWWNLWQ